VSSSSLRPDRTGAARRRGGGRRRLGPLLALPLPTLLGGCNFVVLHPAGYVAEQQRNLVLASTGLMLLIIVPVIVCTLVFAWHYRATNEKAVYDPDWHHSTQLEVLIWTAPLMIIIALGALTWIGTHTLDPFRPLSRIDAKREVPAGVEPLQVEAIAMDWKWLFLYPQYGIATVNDLALPVDRPVAFKITATDVMNTFYVPTLAGMIYAMPGMETKLHAVINKPGDSEGRSAHYSGAGFSNMFFKFRGLADKDFDAWVAKAKQDGTDLSQEAYLKLSEPTEAEPARYFKSYAEGLYGKVLGLCPRPGQMCVSEMMAIDARGGQGGEAGEENYKRLRYDNHFAREGHEPPGATGTAAGRNPHGQTQPEGMKPRPDMGNPDSRGERPDKAQPNANTPTPNGDQIAPKQLNE
jgi:cytochrome o ubiquinol oxidase subunit II